MKSLAAACGIVLAGAVADPATAQVTGVVAGSDVELRFKPSATGPGAPAGIVTDSGAVISGNFGSTGFGSGSSYALTSDVSPGVIYFKNGNASTGQFTRAVSTTLIDITFRNNGTETVTPSLRSQILPAGFGMFIGPGACPNDPSACNPADPLPGTSPATFDSLRPSNAGPEAPSNILGTASFAFRIYADKLTAQGLPAERYIAYELTADLALVYGGGGGNPNTIITNIGQAQADLDGFEQQSPVGSRDFIGFVWGTTDLDVAFAPLTLLAPGESATLRYETVIETSTNTNCVPGTASGCLVNYAAFEDPVGRPGSSTGRIGLGDNKLALAMSPFALNIPGTDPDGIVFGEVSFQIPRFENGRLTFLLTPVPEPQSWAMLIAGFGLVGASMRRRRQLPA